MDPTKVIPPSAHVSGTILTEATMSLESITISPVAIAIHPLSSVKVYVTACVPRPARIGSNIPLVIPTPE